MPRGVGRGGGWVGVAITVNVLDITKWTKEVNDAEPTLLQDSLGFAGGEHHDHRGDAMVRGIIHFILFLGFL